MRPSSEIYTQVKAYNQYTEQAAAKVEEIVGYIFAYLAHRSKSLRVKARHSCT